MGLQTECYYINLKNRDAGSVLTHASTIMTGFVGLSLKKYQEKIYLVLDIIEATRDFII